MVKHKLRWKPEASRRHVYMLNQAVLEPRVYPAFIQTLFERGNIIRMEPKDIKSGLLFGKKRSSLWCKFGDFEAWFTAATTGPDLYVGYYINPRKKELSEIETQDLEALGDYMSNALSETLAKLGMDVEDLEEGEGQGEGDG
jgi:hypothetical protein